LLDLAEGDTGSWTALGLSTFDFLRVRYPRIRSPRLVAMFSFLSKLVACNMQKDYTMEDDSPTTIAKPAADVPAKPEAAGTSEGDDNAVALGNALAETAISLAIASIESAAELPPPPAVQPAVTPAAPPVASTMPAVDAKDEAHATAPTTAEVFAADASLANAVTAAALARAVSVAVETTGLNNDRLDRLDRLDRQDRLDALDRHEVKQHMLDQQTTEDARAARLQACEHVELSPPAAMEEETVAAASAAAIIAKAIAIACESEERTAATAAAGAKPRAPEPLVTEKMLLVPPSEPDEDEIAVTAPTSAAEVGTEADTEVYSL